jgi:transcriptional regulator with XRE-family HTH domain
MEEGKRLRLQSHDVIVRMYRNSRFRTKEELAERLGVTGAYVTKLMQPREDGGSVPRERIANRIAQVCGRDTAQRTLYRVILHEARRATQYPETAPWVPEHALPPLCMPKAFRRRLERDLAKLTARERRHTASKAKLTYRELQEVLRGTRVLDPWQVMQVAQALSVSVDGYLALAEYVAEVPADQATSFLMGVGEKLSRSSYNELVTKVFSHPFRIVPPAASRRPRRSSD